MAAQEETEGYAEAMNEAIASATRAESERDALKRKYEPDTGVLFSKMLRLVGTDSTSYMRVTVRTGGYLLLELVPRVRNNGNLPNWTFSPVIQGTRGNMQDFSDYGTYEVNVGDDGDCHDLLVTFSEPATVELTVVTEHDGAFNAGPDTMTIEEVTTRPAVTLGL